MSHDANQPAVTTQPIELLVLCQQASRFAPLTPSAERGMSIALTVLAAHYGDNPGFYLENRRMVERAATLLREYLAECGVEGFRLAERPIKPETE